MTICCLHDKKTIEEVLRKNVYLNIYGIGDLDDFFWPYTIWYAEKNDSDIRAIALLYFGMSLPTLLALSDMIDDMAYLVQSISHLLPDKFSAHLSPGVESALKEDYRIECRGKYLKMGLTDRTVIDAYDSNGVVTLEIDDLNEIMEFYHKSHPGNWFDPRMLETKRYFGARWDDALVSVAGIHVYSEKYKVAALGNIATAPSYRNRGYASRVTAKTCQELLNRVSHVGLNVKADNAAAVVCYEKLGFEKIASYNEYMIERK